MSGDYAMFFVWDLIHHDSEWWLFVASEVTTYCTVPFWPVRLWLKDDWTRPILVCELGHCISPMRHGASNEWVMCQLVSGTRVNHQNCWCLGCGGWVSNFCICSFHCCFTVDMLLFSLSPTIHEHRVMVEWLIMVLIDACGRMVGADCTVFLHRSCSEFQVEFALNRSDSAQNDCHRQFR